MAPAAASLRSAACIEWRVKAMVALENAVVWVNLDTHEVMVRPHGWRVPEDYTTKRERWRNPIGASYSQWQRMPKRQRLQLMLETCIDLAMQDFPLTTVLRAFAEVPEFRALGSESYPMCRALTSALLGQCLNPETMTFDELLVHYANR
jgi:hypothetical protein